MRTSYLTLFALWFSFLVACDDRAHLAANAPALTVRVVSDFRAGSETTRLVVDVFEGAQSASSRRLTEASRNLGLADALDRGIDVAEIAPIAAGTYSARATLLRATGDAVASRTVVVDVSPPQTITIHLTRDCLGVVCPNSASASQTECLGGVCVDPRCTAATPEHCPGMKADCVSNDDCAGAGVCSTNECVEGVCIDVATPGECDETEYCTGPEGCAPIDGPTMPTGPDPRCGLVCRLPEEPCRYGYYACEGTSVVCTPFTTRPTGAPCGDGNVCSPAGECIVPDDAGTDMEVPFDMTVVPRDMAVPRDMTVTPLDMATPRDMNVPVDMNAPMDMSVAMDMTPDMTPDMEPDMPPVIRACNDGFDNDGDGTVDMDDPDCEEPLDDDEFTPLEEDCSRRWVATVPYGGNLSFNATDSRVVVSGISTICAVTGLDAADGSQVWQHTGSACMTGAVRGNVGVYQRYSGPYETERFDLTTGERLGSFTYTPGTWGWSGVTPMAIGPAGDVLSLQYVYPSAIGSGAPLADWAIRYDDGTEASGPGPAFLTDVHDADDEFVGFTSQTDDPPILPLDVVALDDGRWVMLLNNPSPDDIEWLGATLAPFANTVVYVDHEVTTAVRSTVTTSYRLANIPGTDRITTNVAPLAVRAISGSAEVVWQQNWCRGEVIGATDEYVYVSVWDSPTACGYRLVGYEAGARMIVRLDAATGAVAGARWLRAPELHYFDVAPNGDLYGYRSNGEAFDIAVCGDVVTSVPASGLGIVAL